MLPLGHIAIITQDKRFTRFTKDEQITMMTLWCLFRSPLMMGGELRDNDAWTLSLLTNPELLRLLTHSHGAKQLLRREDTIIWSSKDADGGTYVAFFNTACTPSNPEISFAELGIRGSHAARDVWAHEDIGVCSDKIKAAVPPHGAVIYKLDKGV